MCIVHCPCMFRLHPYMGHVHLLHLDLEPDLISQSLIYMYMLLIIQLLKQMELINQHPCANPGSKYLYFGIFLQ